MSNETADIASQAAVTPVPAPFTRADANAIMVLAHRAPLQNLTEAQAVSAVLERFRAFIEANVSS